MSERAEHGDVEQRLRAGLHRRAGDFTVSPDAWQRTLARRAGAVSRVSPRRPRLQTFAPLAAAAVIIALAAVTVLGLRAVPHGTGRGVVPDVGASPTESGSSPPASMPPPSQICPTAPAPSVSPPVPMPSPPAYTVTQASPGSVPAAVRDSLQQAPAISAIMRIDESFRGDTTRTYLWFSRARSAQDADLRTITGFFPSPGANPSKAVWAGGGANAASLPPGAVAEPGGGSTDMRAAYSVGIASSQVASLSVVPRGLAPIPGLIVSAPGFPYRVWLASLLPTPSWPTTLIFRDSAGQVLLSKAIIGNDQGGSCYPVASLDYAPPRGAHAYSIGKALLTVASVTAVLPDGRQVKGTIDPHKLGSSPGTLNPYRQWQVTYPREDANVSVILVFRDAAGQVLDRLTSIPAKNPFTPVSGWGP